MKRLVFAICVLFLVAENSSARTSARTTVSVVDFGATQFGKLAAEKLRAHLKSKAELLVADGDLSRSAAMGIGYTGSLNLTVSEARDLGAALATEFYFLGDAQTLRRSSSKTPVYYEAYCSIFLVNSRTGRLLVWDRPAFESNEATSAGSLLPATPVIEEAPDDEKIAEAQGLRLPRPYRRLRPQYPETAARAEAEATVDILVDVGADGEVSDVQVVRWAGFGLDEATIASVRQMHFFPALKNGTAIPLRVLLRYNFRKPPR
jgi:TonB family protein